MASATTTVELHFAGKGLKDMDTFSKSDPYVLLYTAHGGKRHALVGRTETIQNNLNPVFQTTITMDYHFESRQDLEVVVMDDDGRGIAGDDHIGAVPFQLGHVMSSRGATLHLPLSKGELIVTGVEVCANPHDKVLLGLAARDLQASGCCGTAAYYTIQRMLPTGPGPQVHKSEATKGINPVWPTATLPMKRLVSRRTSEETLLVRVYSAGLLGDDEVGEVLCSIDRLRETTTNPLPLKRRGSARPCGELYANSYELAHVPSFAEYLSNGWEINLAVAVDFTASNKDPNNPASLHHRSLSKANEYERAIRSVGSILMEYDRDKQVPAFGFGAVLPNTSSTSHFFHLNMQPNPYVADVGGVLEAYAAALGVVRLSGPTNFTPVIRAATEGARSARGVYTVLLIITDGEISDMDDTISALIAADDAPISVVIVGVGTQCDFRNMTVLDGDGGFLRDQHRSSRRDLVQFVPMRDFAKAPVEQLAAEVLREIPDQFVVYGALAKAPLRPRPE